MSKPFDLVVRGGLVITPRGRAPLDVYVRERQVVTLESRDHRHAASRVIDAEDLLVLPGDGRYPCTPDGSWQREPGGFPQRKRGRRLQWRHHDHRAHTRLAGYHGQPAC